jgi:chemotaxis signal transduction protein
MNNYSHIYNKQSYTQVAFLEQLSDQEFWNYAQSLASQQNAPPTKSEEALECQTEQGHYLLPLQALREVISAPHKLTLLPLCPAWMLGITAWRGHVVPVVDLASYFIVHQMSALDTTSTTQRAYPLANSVLLILDDANSLLGIQVAVIGSTITLEQRQLVSPEQAPSWYPRRLLTMLLGVYNGSVILNPPVLIAERMRRIKVSAPYE